MNPADLFAWIVVGNQRRLPRARLRAPWWRRLLARIRARDLSCASCAQFGFSNRNARRIFHSAHRGLERLLETRTS